jgi:hypothetical protein
MRWPMLSGETLERRIKVHQQVGENPDVSASRRRQASGPDLGRPPHERPCQD